MYLLLIFIFRRCCWRFLSSSCTECRTIFISCQVSRLFITNTLPPLIYTTSSLSVYLYIYVSLPFSVCLISVSLPFSVCLSVYLCMFQSLCLSVSLPHTHTELMTEFNVFSFRNMLQDIMYLVVVCLTHLMLL